MMVISKFLKKLKVRRELRKRRELGIFDATLYLIVRENEKIRSKYNVEVFGEFTEDAPWQRKIPCIFD